MFNKAILIGRVGINPELSVSQNGTGICKFTVATTSGFGDKKRTDWHHVVCFGKLADSMSKYVQKGTVVNVDGTIQYSEYEKDGQKRTYTSILANSINIISGGNFGKSDAPQEVVPGGATPAPSANNYPTPNDVTFGGSYDSDIPF
jgi:single-strand DNA-binding protein